MSTSTTGARHRAAGRPLTPLDDLVSSATGSIAILRRSAVAAATGGLVLAVGVPAATAAPSDATAVGNVDVSSLTAQARTALAVSEQVTVPATAAWGFTAPEFTVEANPEPEPVVIASTSVARTEQRAPVANAPVPQSVAGNAVLEIAARYVGVPYVAGGKGPDGFDCSGFTSFVYGQLGVALSPSSADQRWAGVEVAAADALPGDIIWSPGHVGIYAGDGLQIDAPRPGKTIQFRGIWQSNPVYLRITG